MEGEIRAHFLKELWLAPLSSKPALFTCVACLNIAMAVTIWQRQNLKSQQ